MEGPSVSRGDRLDLDPRPVWRCQVDGIPLIDLLALPLYKPFPVQKGAVGAPVDDKERSVVILDLRMRSGDGGRLKGEVVFGPTADGDFILVLEC